MTWVYHATPELERDSSHPTIISVTVVFCSLMLVVVVTRGIYRRKFLGWDDWVIFATATISTAYAIMAIVQTRWGLGLAVDDRPAADVYHFSILSYAGKPLYFLAVGGYKVALCLGYLRFIEGAMMKTYRWTIISVGVGALLLHIGFVLVTCFSCIPPAKIWDVTLKGYCLPWLTTQYVLVSLGILSDVIVFLLPIPLFLKLSIDRRVAIGISILFACGLITTICSIIRATYLKEVGPGGHGKNTLVVVMGSVEANVGIIMSCLPFLRGVLKEVFKSPGRTLRYHRTGGRSRRAKHPSQGMPMHDFGTAQSTQTYPYEVNVEKSEARKKTESEEAIFSYEDNETRESRGITKTTDVHVERDFGNVV